MSHSAPPVVCVIGKKDSGKTTLAVGLVAELRARGHRVMSVKHGHGFSVDREGTDSWRHRHEGGAERVLMVAPDGMALLGDWGPGGEPGLGPLVSAYLAEADVVVAEGFKVEAFPKIEVFRAAAHSAAIYSLDHPQADSFLAIVTDTPDFEAAAPVFSFEQPDLILRLADLVEKLVQSGRLP